MSDSPDMHDPAANDFPKDLDFEQLGELTLDDIFKSDRFGLLELQKPTERISQLSRLRASFHEILAFFETEGRVPLANSEDLAEAKLGSRLEGLKLNPEKMSLLSIDDRYGLLGAEEAVDLSFDEILSQVDDKLLGDESGLLDVSSLPRDPRRTASAGESAHREKCKDFALYEGHFAKMHAELGLGSAKLVPFVGRHRIVTGSTFILNGQMVFVAEVGSVEYKKTTVRENRRERLRLIFENGTESAMYRQSFSLRLGESATSSEVVSSEYQLLAGDDEATGWIYIARSLSSDSRISSRPNLYKIGFTTTPVKQRIAGAKTNPTYLMAPIEIVGEYRTYNMKTSVLEHLLHRVFGSSRLDISQVGLNGSTYDSTEWFDVPLPVIDHAINAITSGEILNLTYNPVTGNLEPLG